jgi:hypothetical protein
MNLSIDSLYEQSIKLLDYLTHLYKFNNFLVDEIDDNKVKALRDSIVKEDKVKAVRLYLQLDKECDEIRDRHCFNNDELPYRSSFRNIAKDIYRDLKVKRLTEHDDLKIISYILRFISTSDYYVIKDLLIKRSLSWYMYCDFPTDPSVFYNDVYPIEFVLDYCIKISNVYFKWS